MEHGIVGPSTRVHYLILSTRFCQESKKYKGNFSNSFAKLNKQFFCVVMIIRISICVDEIRY